jgi:hypothetical protein
LACSRSWSACWRSSSPARGFLWTCWPLPA